MLHEKAYMAWKHQVNTCDIVASQKQSLMTTHNWIVNGFHTCNLAVGHEEAYMAFADARSFRKEQRI